jgi:ketosteroid isomerase-like protein
MTPVPDWLRRHYEAVDDARLDDYLADFADDVELRFGAGPVVRGKGEVRAALAEGHARHRMSHEFLRVWESGSTTLAEFAVTYTYPDGRVETVPALTVLERPSGLVTSMRVYIDRLRG